MSKWSLPDENINEEVDLTELGLKALNFLRKEATGGMYGETDLSLRILNKIKELQSQGKVVNGKVLMEQFPDYSQRVSDVLNSLFEKGLIHKPSRNLEGITEKGYHFLNVAQMNGWKILSILIDKGLIRSEDFWGAANDPSVLGAHGESEAQKQILAKFPKPPIQAPGAMPAPIKPPAPAPAPTPLAPPPTGPGPV